jgi:hypothetical protein
VSFSGRIMWLADASAGVYTAMACAISVPPGGGGWAVTRVAFTEPVQQASNSIVPAMRNTLFIRPLPVGSLNIYLP